VLTAALGSIKGELVVRDYTVRSIMSGDRLSMITLYTSYFDKDNKIQ
jgi:hypothetical protein